MNRAIEWVKSLSEHPPRSFPANWCCTHGILEPDELARYRAEIDEHPPSTIAQSIIDAAERRAELNTPASDLDAEAKQL